LRFLFAYLPELNGATGRFMLVTMASVAELEAGLISERTKTALKAAKARGVQLGRHGAEVLAPKGRTTRSDLYHSQVFSRIRIACSVLPASDWIVDDPPPSDPPRPSIPNDLNSARLASGIEAHLP
jgi:hypothetical protein